MFRKILSFFGVLPFKEILENGILNEKLKWYGEEGNCSRLLQNFFLYKLLEQGFRNYITLMKQDIKSKILLT